jgi:hypothetical protein
MTKHQTNASNTRATDSSVETSKKVATELTEEQLGKVTGGHFALVTAGSAKMSIKVSPEYTRMQTTG